MTKQKSADKPIVHTMKRVGVITINDPSQNVGNRLQNYAVIKVLNSLGFKVKTLNTSRQSSIIKTRIKAVLNALSGFRLSKSQISFIRQIKYHKFIKKYLNTSNELINNKFYPDNYSFFVLGSDQVWNPLWYTTLKKQAFLLTFAKPEQKVCFSPSFGIDEIPSDWEEWFRINLDSFPFLSVRENTGAKIIKELTGRDSVVLIDPTLMLTKQDWLSLSKKPRRINFSTPYLLVYFLGDKTQKIKDDIAFLSQKYGLVVYDVSDKTQPYVYSSGPCEFLYLMSKASLVVTDSFHACVYSFLFEKPFLVYSRNGKNNNIMSRMETLFDVFDLRRKYVDSGLENDVFECDYSIGLNRLNKEREKVRDYLKKTMGLL